MATVTSTLQGTPVLQEKTLSTSPVPQEAESSILDWPNEAGFQTLHEERMPVSLPIKGTIPSYCAGALYRTGPSAYKASHGSSEFKVDHWFDGFGHTHRFEIIPGEDGTMKVMYSSRRANDGLTKNIEKSGKYGYTTFGQRRDPCVGVFGKVMSVFQSALNINMPTDPTIANVSVTIRPNMPGPPSSRKEGHSTALKTLWTTSDNAQLKELNPLTLEPIGIASQKVLHPSLKGPLSCAHAQSDHLTGDVYNYNLALGRLATYRVFKTSALTGKTEILATISGNGVRPAYLHSFFLTEDFVVLCIWNAHFEGMGLKILIEQNLLDAIAQFDNKQPARWFVIDRKQERGLVAEFESPAAFCFHTINAWQETNERGEVDIMCNLSEYENLDILHALYYTNMTSGGANAVTFNKEKGVTSLPRFARYRLKDIGSKTTKVGKEIKKAELVLSLPKRIFGDLPTMNPLFQTKPNRYIYSIVNDGRSTFLNSISKVDTVTKEVKFWDNEFGHTPGEAIFVPDPEGKEEDDGCLLSVVLDGRGEKSYLVVLDARTMREVGRASCEWIVGLGFHGAHVKV